METEEDGSPAKDMVFYPKWKFGNKNANIMRTEASQILNDRSCSIKRIQTEESYLKYDHKSIKNYESIVGSKSKSRINENARKEKLANEEGSFSKFFSNAKIMAKDDFKNFINNKTNYNPVSGHQFRNEHIKSWVSNKKFILANKQLEIFN